MPITGVIASEWRPVGPLALVTTYINTALYVNYSLSFGYVSATGGSTNYRYTSTTLPAGLTLNSSTGAITGTLTAGVSSVTVTFTVTDLGIGGSKSGNVTFVIGPVLSVSFTGGTSLTVNSVYAGGAVTAVGGNSSAGYVYSLVGGYALPYGLTLNSDGTITGTPSGGPGSTVQSKFNVVDADGNNAQTTIITWSITTTLTVSTTLGNSPTVIDAAGLGSATATGGTGPYTYSYTGNFPNGITNMTTAGVIQGTVTAGIGGTFSPTISARDSLGNTGSRVITYTVTPTSVSAVTSVVATRTSNTTVGLTWTLPTVTNNIASITITSSPSITLSYSTTPSSTSATVTGSFVVGQAYTFTVTTNNSAGSASSSASNSVTPASNTLTVNYIIVGGGGGGGWYTGGGAGQVKTGSVTVTIGSPISINCGAGGTYPGGTAGGNNGSQTDVNGGINVTSIGGSGGASGATGTGNKGSGGSSGNGYTGGSGASYRGGGGAGAGGNGAAGTGTTTGNSVGGNGGAYWGSYYMIPQYSYTGTYFPIGYGGEGHGAAGNGNGNGNLGGSFGGGGGWEQSGGGGEVILYFSATDYPGTPTNTGTQYIGTDGNGNAVYMWGSSGSGGSSGTITF